MTQKQRIATFVGLSSLIVVAALMLFIYKQPGKEGFVSPHVRVMGVVVAWSRLTSPPKDTDLLEAMWARSGPSFEFYPYGAQDLEGRLRKAFPESKRPVMRYTDLYAAANPAAKVKTVFDLSELVRYNYEPQ